MLDGTEPRDRATELVQVECFKWGLVGHTSRSMEDSINGSDLNCGDLDQEVSEEKNISMWPRD